MPSKSKAQHNLMAAVANNAAFAKKVGISKSVGEEFMKADKTKKFGAGGALKEVDSSDNPGLSKLPTEVRNKMGYMKKGGMAKKCMKEGGMTDKAQDKAMIKKAFKMHDSQEHKGEHTNLAKLKKGGMMKKMAMGGKVKETMGPRTMSQDVEKGSNKLIKFGESAVQKRGHTKGKNLGDSGPSIGIEGGGMKKGGKVKKMARGGGIEVRGKTKGKMC